ncbi:MAG: phosphatidate cytidylyltransferase [Alistipes inops]
MAKFGKELAVRTLSGAVLLLVVVGAVSVSEYGFAALMLTICVGSLWEFYRMAAKKGLSVDRVYPVAVGGVAVAMSFLVARVRCGRVALIFFPLLHDIRVQLRRRPPEPFIHRRWSGSICRIADVADASWLFAEADAWTILCYIFTVWVNDIFAYLTGVLFGKHKMFERVSPKKSWEGFAGGLLFAVAFGVMCGWLRGEDMVWWGGLALVVVVSGVLGDLVESMFKRSAGVKDSGAIIPGHGGFMDRFDALIFSVPFVFAYFTIFAG